MRQPFKSIMRHLSTPVGEFQLLKLLGKGKSGYSHLAQGPAGHYVVKLMHDEPCDYYQFGTNKVESEIYAYKILKEMGLNIPTLVHSDSHKNYLIKEFLDGPTAAQWIIDGGESSVVLPELFSMAAKSRTSGFNIDYFPTNFIVGSDHLYYIDYEINVYDPQWDLINWGLYYWANRNGLSDYFKSGDHLSINLSSESGKPITEPFREIVDGWIELYSLDST